MLNRNDKTELNIVLQRAGYVLAGCATMALIVVSILIFK